MLVRLKKVEHYKLKKYINFLKVCIKMVKTIIKSDDIKTSKQKLHQHKRPISIKDADNDKILLSNNVPFDKKDLIFP